jgi:hypothetical protein
MGESMPDISLQGKGTRKKATFSRGWMLLRVVIQAISMFLQLRKPRQINMARISADAESNPSQKYSDPPGWKHLINSPLPTHELTPLITAIFSNSDEIDVIKRLDGDDAQSFVNTIYEACPRTLLHL